MIPLTGLPFSGMIPDSNGRCFDFLFAFGDSLTDTGNTHRISLLQQRMHPYGQTFFRHPCDRFWDGRLLIDFIGENQTNRPYFNYLAHPFLR
ncbi:hypothetical protein O6H91_14G021900 [Diphasiastrum complanatum]|uniref:Uncharacterized protein n=1 Tax=Diphasiastrum complanatum TaxID=34168 RepID=A0ACC2BM94_DIPCM|nr:hypothetical protein O6H91_14G021900 [Diphasiastrum complanatum]